MGKESNTTWIGKRCGEKNGECVYGHRLRSPDEYPDVGFWTHIKHIAIKSAILQYWTVTALHNPGLPLSFLLGLYGDLEHCFGTTFKRPHL